MQATPTTHPTAHNDHVDARLSYSVWPAWKVLLQDAGVNSASVLRGAQLPSDLFEREGVRLDSASYYRLWQAISVEASRTSPPAPLQFAHNMSTDWFNPELFVALCSRDLEEALSRLARYKSGPVLLKLDHDTRGTSATLAFPDMALPPPQVLVIFKLIFLVQLARLATRNQIYPLQVGWPAAALSPEDADAYASWFGIPVADLPAPTVVFASADTQRPFLTANHGMWKFFEPSLRHRTLNVETPASASERVRGVLVEALPAGEVSMQAVCRKLGLSTRSLQRRLHEEGSSFQQTLDAVRSELAHHYLHNSPLSSTEIALLLGFKETNSFMRAFQRWTGSTPQVVRLTYARGSQLLPLPQN